MGMQGVPLSASDVRAIADALEPIELDPHIAENPVIGRIEVLRPDGEDATDIVGYFRREGEAGSGDAWFGFEAVTS